MADRERKGLVARWLEGKERSEDYARGTLPTSRWSLFWDILKGRFGRLMLVNLLVLLTCVPIAVIIFFQNYITSALGTVGSYGAGLGMGYPFIPETVGQAEMMILQTDLFFFALLIPASVIAAVGFSGGMYIIRNLIWTEGIFVANDFVRGIKRNFLNVMEAALILSILIFLARIMGDFADLFVARGLPGAGWMVASKVIGYIFVAFGILVCMWMVSLGVNYKQGAFALVRNAMVMTIGTFPQTVLFAFAALWPVLLALFGSKLIGILMIIGIIFLILIGFSYMMLVWMDFSQWAFDKYVNPAHGVATGRGLYNKDRAANEQQAPRTVSMEESAAMREYRRQVVAQGKSKLACRPIKPIDDGVDVYQLPDSFSRDDLQKLKESRSAVEEDVKLYEEEHKNDEQFVEYNRLFEERERALNDDGSGKKKKSTRQPKMLKRKK